MFRLSNEIRNSLIEEAKKYGKDELCLYQAELGWQDWMNDFTEADEGEPISEAESKEIDKITEEAFNAAHKMLCDEEYEEMEM